MNRIEEERKQPLTSKRIGFGKVDGMQIYVNIVVYLVLETMDC